MKKRKKIVAASLLAAALLYIGSYMVFSVQGQYQNACWRVPWLKDTVWVPRGFIVRIYESEPGGGRSCVGERKSILQTIFLPLWGIDVYVIHNREKAMVEQ